MQIDADGNQAVGVNSGHNIYFSDISSGGLFTFLPVLIRRFVCFEVYRNLMKIPIPKVSDCVFI